MRFPAEASDAGKRLDQFVHEQLPQFSRSRIQDWIKSGRVAVNGQGQRPSYAVRSGDAVNVDPAEPPPLRAEPEPIPLSILYEDADLVAIDKAAGMVVHAGAGVHAGTLVNALLHHYGALSAVGGALRPGIVHRLDRYTSGGLLVGQNRYAQQSSGGQVSPRQGGELHLSPGDGMVKAESGRIDR